MINYIFAQIFGTIAILIVAYSYLQKHKNKYVLLQISANICFISQFLLLLQFSASLSSFISLIRTLVFYSIEKKGKKVHIGYLLLFQILIIIVGIFTYTGPISLIPILLASTYGVGMYVKDLRITYSITIFNTILWIIYNFIVKAHANCIGNIFELVVSIIGLTKLIIYKNKLNKEDNKEAC